MDRNRNRMAIWGRKVSTPPTPAITPSHHQGLHPGATPGGVPAPCGPIGEIVSPISVSTPSASELARPEGEGRTYGQHHQRERPGWPEFVGHDGVDPVRQGQAPREAGPASRSWTTLLDELVAAVGDQGLPVAQGIGPLILPADGFQPRPAPDSVRSRAFSTRASPSMSLIAAQWAGIRAA